LGYLEATAKKQIHFGDDKQEKQRQRRKQIPVSGMTNNKARTRRGSSALLCWIFASAKMVQLRRDKSASKMGHPAFAGLWKNAWVG
jgi:hypothetical protein